MKAAWVRAERDSEVREAARSWRRAGVVGEDTLSAVESVYAAPWPRPTPLWMVLAFVFVSIAVLGLFAAIAFSVHGVAGISGIAATFAVALAIAADRTRASASASVSAAGAAAAFWAVVCLLVFVMAREDFRDSGMTSLLAAGAVAFAAGAWRWGYPAFAFLCAAFLFLFLARFPPGRVLWLVLGTALCGLSLIVSDAKRIAPSHRRCAAAVFLVCAAAAYAAINPYSLDKLLIESIAPGPSPATSTFTVWGALLQLAAASLLPAGLVAWGIWKKRRLPLDIGLVLAALSVATLRYYVHVAPLWAILCGAGALLIGLCLLVHRRLAGSAAGRPGFTADPLFGDERTHQTLGILGALALAPSPAEPAPAEPGAFRGGGGSSGGAGSSGSL